MPRCSPAGRAWSRCCRCDWPLRGSSSTSTACPSWPTSAWTGTPCALAPWPGKPTSSATIGPPRCSRCSGKPCGSSRTRRSAIEARSSGAWRTPIRPPSSPPCSLCSGSGPAGLGSRRSDGSSGAVFRRATFHERGGRRTGRGSKLSGAAATQRKRIRRGLRRHGDYAICGVAVCVTVDEDGELRAGKAAFISVGPTPVVVELSESVAGTHPGGDLSDVHDAVCAAVTPEPDIHASAEYRRHLAGVLAVRAIREAAQRAAA